MTSKRPSSLSEPPENSFYSGSRELEDNSRYLIRYNRDIARMLSSHLAARTRGDGKGKNADTLPTIIDFGAGIGTLTHAMNALGIRADYICIEQDETLLKRIRPFAQRVHNLREVDLEQRGDLVFSANVLEHIEDDVNILRELSKCLKKEGTLAIYVPAMPMLWTAMDNNVGHFRRYTRRTLMATALQAGLSIERVLYIDTMGAIATMIYKLLERLQEGDSYKPPSALALRVYDNAIWPLSRLVDSLMRHSFGKNLLLFCSRR